MLKIFLAVLAVVIFLGVISQAYSYQTHHDMSLIDLQVIETKVIPINYWIREPGDFSDIILIKFEISNNGTERFSIKKDMFRIDVLDPRLQQRTDKELRYTELMVENYYPQYSEDFKLRFQDTPFSHGFEECTLLNDFLPINHTKNFHVCFDVHRLWDNEDLALNGPKEYYLIMNDNKFQTSCPNCKKIKLYTNGSGLEDESQHLPPAKQVSLGIVPNQVTCNENLQLIFKVTNGSPVCVNLNSVNKLLERGWGTLG